MKSSLVPVLMLRLNKINFLLIRSDELIKFQINKMEQMLVKYELIITEQGLR